MRCFASPFLLVAAAMALLALGCSKSDGDTGLAKRCERAIAKVTLEEMYDAPGAAGKPGEDEKAIIDRVRKLSQAQCEAEGLTPEQAACFESIKDIQTLFEAADCPAIAEEKPTWFNVPPPELRRQALEKMRAKEGAE